MTTDYIGPEVLKTYTKYLFQIAMVPTGRQGDATYYMEFEIIAKDIFDAHKDASKLASERCHGYWYITNIWQ